MSIAISEVSSYMDSMLGELEYFNDRVFVKRTPLKNKRTIYSKISKVCIEVSNSEDLYESGYFQKFINLFDSGILDRTIIENRSIEYRIRVNAANMAHCDTFETITFILDSTELTDESKVATVVSYLANYRGFEGGGKGISKELAMSLASQQVNFESILKYPSVELIKCYLHSNFLALCTVSKDTLDSFSRFFRAGSVTSSDYSLLELLKLQAFLETKILDETYSEFKVRTKDITLAPTKRLSLDFMGDIECAIGYIVEDPSEYLVSTSNEIKKFLLDVSDDFHSKSLKEHKRASNRDIKTFEKPALSNGGETTKGWTVFGRYLSRDENGRIHQLIKETAPPDFNARTIEDFLKLMLCNVFIYLGEDRFVDFLKEFFNIGWGKSNIRYDSIFFTKEELETLERIYYAIIEGEHADYPVSWIAQIV